MKEGEDCQLCIETLNESCARFNGPFCEIKEEYMTDPNMSSEDVVVKLMGIMTPEQRQEVADALVTQGKAEKVSTETP